MSNTRDWYKLIDEDGVEREIPRVDIVATPAPLPPVPPPLPAPAPARSRGGGVLRYILPVLAALIGGYLAWSKGKAMAVGIALVSALVVWLIVRFFLGW